jgi:hypothetical protein
MLTSSTKVMADELDPHGILSKACKTAGLVSPAGDSIPETVVSMADGSSVPACEVRVTATCFSSGGIVYRIRLAGWPSLTVVWSIGHSL